MVPEKNAWYGLTNKVMRRPFLFSLVYQPSFQSFCLSQKRQIPSESESDSDNGAEVESY